MQSYSEIEAHIESQLPVERTLASGAFLLFTSVLLVVLAFIPLVPPSDAIEGGGFTGRGVIEIALIMMGLVLMGMYAKARDIPAFDFRNFSFAIITLFTCWAIVSSLWSPNPMLSIAKAAELWSIIIAAGMFVTIGCRIYPKENQLETTLAFALLSVLVILIVANLFFWGTPLPSTGDESLNLQLLGEEPPVLIERPRLILAYAHPLLTGDFLALSLVCLFATRMNRALKVIAIPILLGLLWMADARGPSIAIVASLIAMIVLQVRRKSVRVIAITLLLSLGLAITMLLQDKLLKPISALLTDDVLTLNSRTELWAKAFEHIGKQPVIGYGYYSSRYLLMKDFIWGGHAHNSFIEVLLTTGLIGFILFCIYLAYVCRDVITTRNSLLLGVIVYSVIQGMLNPLLFTPGLPMFVLTIAVLNARWKHCEVAA